MKRAKEHKVVYFKSLSEAPFKSDEAQARAIKDLFSTGRGQNVLNSLILDCDYTRPELPRQSENAYNVGFDAGKRYFINHILHAMAVEYEDVKEGDDE